MRQATGRLLCALMLAAAAAAASGTEPASVAPDQRAKSSSFAPHHSKRHVYGAPIQKPLVHKRKKHAHGAPPASAPVEPIK